MSKDVANRVVVNIEYTKYVMPMEDATAVLRAFCNAEIYEMKWRDDTKDHTHHIYPVKDTSGFSMHMLGKEIYDVAKLAGKPE